MGHGVSRAHALSTNWRVLATMRRCLTRGCITSSLAASQFPSLTARLPRIKTATHLMLSYKRGPRCIFDFRTRGRSAVRSRHDVAIQKRYRI